MFLGHSVTQRKNVSEATAKLIDEEIRRLVDEGEETARAILTERLEELHALAKGLLEYETMSADEIRRIILAASASSAKTRSAVAAGRGGAWPAQFGSVLRTSSGVGARAAAGWLILICQSVPAIVARFAAVGTTR